MPCMERDARRGGHCAGDVERVDKQRLRDAGGKSAEPPECGIDEHIVALAHRQNLDDAILVLLQRDRVAVEPSALGAVERSRDVGWLAVEDQRLSGEEVLETLVAERDASLPDRQQRRISNTCRASP